MISDPDLGSSGPEFDLRRVHSGTRPEKHICHVHWEGEWMGTAPKDQENETHRERRPHGLEGHCQWVFD